MKKPPTDLEKERAYKDLYEKVNTWSLGQETTLGSRIEMACKELEDKKTLELERATAVYDEPFLAMRGVDS